MASITIRNIDEELKACLRLQAARHGLSMEEEARCILRQTLHPAWQAKGLGSRIHQRFGAIGGIDLELPKRNDLPRAADLAA
jgi:plasmid stability protein